MWICKGVYGQVLGRMGYKVFYQLLDNYGKRHSMAKFILETDCPLILRRKISVRD